MVTYCSEQLQKEYWFNAHKEHCKYLAGTKVLLNGKHNDAYCLICKEESRTGKVNMSQPDNKVLPCYMFFANKTFINKHSIILPKT